jgi:site-specific DNA recombinase
MNTRAIGYVRVSTDDQAREGVSLDVQEARIGAYCEAKGWQLVSVVRDEGKSAKDLKRPGLQQVLVALQKRQRCFDALVVVKLDRLTRSVRDLGNLMEAFKRARVGFTSIQESVDTAKHALGHTFWKAVSRRTPSGQTKLFHE